VNKVDHGNAEGYKLKKKLLIDSKKTQISPVRNRYVDVE
jgi:hypothetical protein